MRLDDLRLRLRELGAGTSHERAVLRAWIHARPLDHGPRPANDFLPLRLRKALPALSQELASLAQARLEESARTGVWTPGAGLVFSRLEQA